eukprot:5804294-Pyramimonas_sp.AAC.1
MAVIRDLDNIMTRWPHMHITFYVDDASFQRRADPITISEELGDAVAYYIDQIEGDGTSPSHAVATAALQARGLL